VNTSREKARLEEINLKIDSNSVLLLSFGDNKLKYTIINTDTEPVKQQRTACIREGGILILIRILKYVFGIAPLAAAVSKAITIAIER